MSAEVKLLSCILRNESFLLDHFSNIHDKLFTSPETILLWNTIQRVWMKYGKINISVIKEDLGKGFPFEQFKKGYKDPLGYLDAVRNAYLKREVTMIANKVLKELSKPGADVTKLIDRIEERFTKLSSDTTIKPTDFAAAMLESEQYLTSTFEKVVQGEVNGIDLVVDGVNALSGGLGFGENLFIGADPGMGKSTYAQSIVMTNSVYGDIEGLVITPEMSNSLYCLRMASSYADVNFQRLKTGFPTPKELERLYAPEHCNQCKSTKIDIIADYKKRKVTHVCKKCGSKDVATKWQSLRDQAKLHMDDRPGPSIYQVLQSIRAHKIRFPNLAYFVVDHIHEITYAPGDNKEERTAFCSKAIRDLGKTLNLASIIICPLNRKNQERKEKRPERSDLRGSGMIEYNADFIILLYRPSILDKTVWSKDALQDGNKEVIEFIIEKQRNGPGGIIVKGYVDLSHMTVFRETIEGDHE